jgi:2-polyprenyl-3-methyl-5-hydroxy-6-metoxy-1,4-benzoquinol methylase
VEPLLQHAESDLGLPMVRSVLWNLDVLGDRQFDAIYTHSLEHVPDVRATLASFRRHLRPGGMLVVEAPNQFEALKERVKAALYAVLGERLSPHLYGEVTPQFHLTFFTPRTLRRFMEEAGFEIVGRRTYRPWNPIYHGTRRLRTVRELSFLVGGLVDRGPAAEVMARRSA